MQPPKYRAFISYSHNDERWARWLHAGLESFRLPGSPRAQRPLKPVFRDRDELSASRDLSATIQEALAASANLIVICSQATTRSEWVAAEVERFQALGRDDRIFCLFVDDSPPDACVPPALARDGATVPLGASVRGDGRRNAKLKLIAGLLDIDFDGLKQRDRARRRRTLAGYAAGSSAALALVSVVTWRVAVEPPCTRSAQLFSSAWNSEREDAIRGAFLATGVPFAQQSVDTVVRTLTDYADRWVAVHRDACEATLVRGEQSNELMDLRMACLAERRERFDALARQYQHGDRETVSNAVRSAKSLGHLLRCSDRRELLAAYPPPEGPLAATVADARRKLAELRALVDSAAVVPARALAQASWDDIQHVEYPPLQADALVLLGRALALDADVVAAESTFVQAASRAVAANDDELAAEAWLGIPELVMERIGGTARARDVLTLARAYVDKLPGNHPLRALYHESRGRVLLLEGDVAGSVEALEQAIALARANDDLRLPTYLERLARIHAGHLQLDSALPLAEEAMELAGRYFGTMHPEYAKALHTYGGIHIDMGDTDTAITYIGQALAIQQQAFPEKHPAIAATWAQLGSAYRLAVQRENAEQALLRSLEIYAAVDAPSPIALGDAHNNLGNLYLDMGRLDESEQHLTKAAELWDSVDFYFSSIALNNLGVMLIRRGDYARARDYCARALAADETQFPADDPNLAYPLTCLGEALVDLGEFEQAREHLQRAFDIRRGKHESPLPMAETRFHLARALWGVNGNREEIEAHYRFALEAVTEHAPEGIEELEAWAAGKDL